MYSAKIFMITYSAIIMISNVGYCAENNIIAGCPIFPEDNVWNVPVDSLPVDANSKDYIESIGYTKYLHPDFGSGLWDNCPIGIPYNVVNSTQKKVEVYFKYYRDSDQRKYPIPENVLIEGGNNSDGDRHIIIIDSTECILYELYDAYPERGGKWSAGSGAIFNLKSNRLRPRSWTSADAAGLPILPGLVKYEEVSSGEVKHALRFTASKTRDQYIWPARHSASRLSSDKYPPMGQRFRLKKDFNIDGFSTEVKVILVALKKYGMILADNGSDWFISGVPDERWNNDYLVNELRSVTGANFEAVDSTLLIINPNSAQTTFNTTDSVNYQRIEDYEIDENDKKSNCFLSTININASNE